MENETVWRLQVEDFEMVMEDSFPEISAEGRQKIIEQAVNRFSIDDWSEYVYMFIDAVKDEIGSK